MVWVFILGLALVVGAAQTPPSELPWYSQVGLALLGVALMWVGLQ